MSDDSADQAVFCMWFFGLEDVFHTKSRRKYIVESE